MEYPSKQIRTYMQYSLPIDPVRIVTIPDMDISYALGTTLVTWSPLKQVREGIARSWKFEGEKGVRFILQPGVAWSDGSPLTSRDVKRSFERAFKAYPGSLRSLSAIIDHFETPNDREIVFALNISANTSNLLGKLTEPNYSILSVNADGTALDLLRSSGPYLLKSADEKEIVLKKNENYVLLTSEMADSIVIRKPKSGSSPVGIILKEEWPNLVEAASMVDAEMLQELKPPKFTLWTRPIDKVGLLSLSSKKLTPEKTALLRYLKYKLSRSVLLAGVTGQTEATQLFPSGYSLYDSKLPAKCEAKSLLPTYFKNHPVRILVSPDRFDEKLRANLAKAIFEAVGTVPEMRLVPITEIEKELSDGDFDFYAGTMGLADPDPEGIMSYYFEGEYSVVPHFDGKYVTALDRARADKEESTRLATMRGILNQSIEDGAMLPLFHYSTIGIGKGDLDFSNIPSTDESVTFSKVRFKKR